MLLISKKRRMWLYRSWLLVSVIALILAVFEVQEHLPIRLNNLELNLVAEVLLLGFVFPLAWGATLGWLNRVHALRPLSANTIPCVLVIENEILGSAIKHRLSQEPGLHVVGIMHETPAEFLHAIQRFKPNVVIMDRGMDLATATGLSTYPSDWPPLRLITVSAKDEWVGVHDIWQVRITQTNELTTLIQDG